MLARAAFGFFFAVASFASSSGAAITGTISGVAVFGDSLSDNGNIYERTNGLVINLPNGPVTVERRPEVPFYTRARFTNGFDNSGLTTGPVRSLPTLHQGLWHERLATSLGVSVAQPSLLGGMNHAFGAAVTGSGGDPLGLIVNMTNQVQQYVAATPVVPADRLHVIFGGGNDLINVASTPGGAPSDVTTAANVAMQNLRGMIVQLYNKGARKFLWPNIPPIERTPRLNFLATSSDPNDQAVFAATQSATANFRANQQTVVANLLATLPDSQISTVDLYGLFENVSNNPSTFGLVNVVDPFVRVDQGLTVSGTQTPASVGVSPDTWVFWDELHPTSFIHKLIADTAIASVPEPCAISLMFMLLPVTSRRRH